MGGCVRRKPSFSPRTSPLPTPSQALHPAEGETQHLLLGNELYVDLTDVGGVSPYKQREKFSSKCINHSCCLTDTELFKCCNLDFRIQGIALHVGKKKTHWRFAGDKPKLSDRGVTRLSCTLGCPNPYHARGHVALLPTWPCCPRDSLHLPPRSRAGTTQDSRCFY